MKTSIELVEEFHRTFGHPVEIKPTVPCCEFCNKAKRNLSYEIFLAHLKRITNYVQSRSNL